VRTEALALHAGVRGVLRVVLRNVANVEAGEADCGAELQASLTELVKAVRHLYRAEAVTLEPALRALDAWGEQSVVALHMRHDRDIARLTGLRTDVSTSRELARQAREMVRVVLRALRLEQVTVLSVERWTDDLTMGDQESG
jgi:hypothetical protein